jgi:hypothetical protein
LLHICWTDRRDDLQRELRLLSDDEYQRFVQTALRFGLLQAWTLPVSGRGDAFLDVYLDSTGSVKTGLTALVRALLRVGEASCLERLAPSVQVQSEPELRALAKVIVKCPGIPELFRQTVGDAVAGLSPRRTGLLGQLVDDWATWFER